MTVRSKRLDVNVVKNDEKTLDDVFDEAFAVTKETEITEFVPKKEKIGAKDGVFEPKPVVKEEKIEKIEEKEPEETGNQPFDPPNAPMPDKKLSVEDEMRAILNTQKGKRAVPSLVTFFSVRSNAQRHVIVDVTDSIMEETWAKYKEIKGFEADEEEFMTFVYKILDVDIPRMYRAVAPVVLKK